MGGGALGATFFIFQPPLIQIISFAVKHIAKIFYERWRGPPNVLRPGKTFPSSPLSTGLKADEKRHCKKLLKDVWCYWYWSALWLITIILCRTSNSNLLSFKRVFLYAEQQLGSSGSLRRVACSANSECRAFVLAGWSSPHSLKLTSF